MIDETRIDEFVVEWNNARQDIGMSPVTSRRGYKYTRVLDNEGTTLGFVDNSTGDVLKAASNAAPATNHVRGSATNPASDMLVDGAIPHLKRGRRPRGETVEVVEVESPESVA